MDGASTSTAKPAVLGILIEDVRWSENAANIESAARATALLALDGRAQGSLCVLLTDDASIQALNAQFRGKDTPTNVLSFPAATGAEAILGDVALAYETVTREAKEQNKTFLHHAQHLILHGVLHLLGYDHETVAEARIMEALETRLLATIGIADPYRSE